MKLLLILLVLPLATLDASVLVRTKQGFLIGSTFPVDGRAVSKFLGVPFAKPPVDNLRFRKTQEADKWLGLKYATKNKKMCPQLGVPAEGYDEDCLYLDIYAPFGGKGKNVMVWIHGGGFAYGTGQLYDASELAARGDVVVVVVQYRLGVFGFIKGNDERAPGNVGLWDQVEALKWVNENIQRFGGDPAKVTIFGESAGGMSVGFHLITTHAQAYFDKAIMQSGSALSVFAAANEKNSNEAFTKFAEDIKCPLDADKKATKDTFDCLENKKVKEIMDIIGKDKAMSGSFFPTSDTQSGSDCFFCRKILDINNDKITNVPLLNKKIFMGINSNEAPEFIRLPYVYPIEKGSDTSKYPKNFAELKAKIQTADREDLKIFMDEKLFAGVTTPVAIRDHLVRLLGDSVFTCPDRMLINHATKDLKDTFTGTIHYYRYDYQFVPPTGLKRPDADWFAGALHADELHMLFGWPSRRLAEKDRPLSNKMIEIWTQFAKTGIPQIQGKPFDNLAPLTENSWSILQFRRDGSIDAEVKTSFNQYPQDNLCHLLNLKFYKDFQEKGSRV